MEIHDLVSRRETVGLHLGDFGLNIVDGEADVIEAELGQIADMRVVDRAWPTIVQ